MRLNPVGTNQTEVETPTALVFFSYKTPVAAFVTGRGYVRSEEKHSQTTTKHINQWLISKGVDLLKVERVPQDFIGALV